MKIFNFDANKVFKFITQVMRIEGNMKGVEVIYKQKPVLIRGSK